MKESWRLSAFLLYIIWVVYCREVEETMERFLELLHQHIDIVERLGETIENGENYMEGIREYLPHLNQIITEILQIPQNSETGLEMNQAFVIQVLNDILYGIENRDSVFLLDVLRYGLLEIYFYIEKELQSEGA